MSGKSRTNIQDFFDAVAPFIIEVLIDELDPESPDVIVAEARSAFIELEPDIPYLDNPLHTMAEAVLFSAVGLAFLKPIRSRDYDPHSVGRAIYAFSKKFNESATSSKDASRSDSARNKSKREADESRQLNDNKIFVWETVDAKDEEASGYNVTSCAICHLYGTYDAIDLVPYMCAGDDLVSDAYDQGLRRNGTIALGAQSCDFRFHYGQPGEPLAARFPDAIKLLGRD